MSASSWLLESSSQISALFHCDNCGNMIDSISWKQCDKCKNFDLCRKCGKLTENQLKYDTGSKHKSFHPNDDPVSSKNMSLVMVGNAEKELDNNIDTINEGHFTMIMKRERIQNDWQMAIVMDALHRENKSSPPSFLSSLSSDERSKLNSMMIEYNVPKDENTVRVLSLDGGGVRGYMSIKILEQLIKDNYLPNIDPKDKEYKEEFKNGQHKFTKQFDYFAGTSTGGLIAFCLATEHPLLEIKEIYANSSDYFKKNWTPWMLGTLGNVMTAKYNDQKIHDAIDNIIKERFKNMPNGEVTLTAANATLHDLHKLLNPNEGTTTVHDTNRKVLLINAYNITTSCITVFNTSCKEHWGYLVGDVLKATMAAPTYFRPWHMCEWEKKEDGNFGKKKDANGKDVEDHIFIDGGVFANDPELTAIWSIRMHLARLVNYRILSIGTGCYSPQLDSNSWGGYWTWVANLFKPGLVVNTLMDATRSLTETVVNDLAKFNNIRRMKFNYKLKISMELDDPKFPAMFDDEWEKFVNSSGKKLTNISEDGSRGLSTDKSKYGLMYGPDYKALLHFYERHIKREQ
ncbi:unnamed protein product [Adineta ricciae]|uniref:PNPLA domain-containing protein n=1 Tax=Adineta ricciae TaxID=249248 RepID=A0A815TJN1_ADIRI|nr:unnamed protein product [Adineta ricciae]CAF1556798.1 unnamed protein product [Adineta ricciae]